MVGDIDQKESDKHRSDRATCSEFHEKFARGSETESKADKVLKLLSSRARVLGAGLERFSRELKRQGVKVLLM